jgi:hypothetical protein
MNHKVLYAYRLAIQAASAIKPHLQLRAVSPFKSSTPLSHYGSKNYIPTLESNFHTKTPISRGYFTFGAIFSPRKDFHKSFHPFHQLQRSFHTKRSIFVFQARQMNTKPPIPTKPNMPPQPLFPPPPVERPHDHYPGLQSFSITKEQWDYMSNTTWKFTKVFLVAYFSFVLIYTFGLRHLFGAFRNNITYWAIQDITRNGSVSMWYIPILYQDRPFTCHFDPKYPSLNYYNLRIFVLKEFEAAFRAAERISNESETLINNASLRTSLLKGVLKRGWSTPNELSTIFEKNGFLSRASTENETLESYDRARMIGQEYRAKKGEIEQRIKILKKNGEPIPEELAVELLSLQDPSFTVFDRINLSQQQIIYLQKGIDEFEKLVGVGMNLQELALQLKTTTAWTLWRLQHNTDEWQFDFSQMSGRYHEVASAAAATGKLCDALCALTSTNIEQIMRFLKYFDQNVLMLNDPGHLAKNKYSLPTFPKLTFEVPNGDNYASQLAILQSQIRQLHDPLYDFQNPRIIETETGQILNPSDPHQPSAARQDIQYVSPARELTTAPPVSENELETFTKLRERHYLDPTFEQEIEYAQEFTSTRFYDNFSSRFQDMKDSYLKDKIDKKAKEEQELKIKEQLEELGKLSRAP